MARRTKPNSGFVLPLPSMRTMRQMQAGDVLVFTNDDAAGHSLTQRNAIALGMDVTTTSRLVFNTRTNEVQPVLLVECTKPCTLLKKPELRRKELLDLLEEFDTVLWSYSMLYDEHDPQVKDLRNRYNELLERTNDGKSTGG